MKFETSVIDYMKKKCDTESHAMRNRQLIIEFIKDSNITSKNVTRPGLYKSYFILDMSAAAAAASVFCQTQPLLIEMNRPGILTKVYYFPNTLSYNISLKISIK